MLAAMVAAQEINKNRKPLYGGYIIGRNWFFVVLVGLRYAISRAYDGTQTDDLTGIVKKTKRNYLRTA